MKTLRLLLSITVLAGLISFMGCGGSDGETEQERTIRLLTSKTWSVITVTVPDNTATSSDDWDNFTVSFTQTNMSTAGHPTGATVVWPSQGYSVNEQGNQITRTNDQVVMSINALTESNLRVSFSMPPGTEIGGRVASLEGPYVFNLE